MPFNFNFMPPKHALQQNLLTILVYKGIFKSQLLLYISNLVFVVQYVCAIHILTVRCYDYNCDMVITQITKIFI